VAETQPVPPPWLVRGMLLVCSLFALLGVLLAAAGSTEIFALWRQAAARSLFDQPQLPSSLAPFVALTDGILGGSIVGKWLAAAYLVRHPFAEGERWGWRALVWGLLSWFLLDSAMSIVLGATFNVWMINLAPLLLFGGPLVYARRFTAVGAPSKLVPSRMWLALRWICFGFAIFGIVVATTSHTLVFGLYQQAIAQVWFEGTLPAEAVTWLRFSYALVGATFLGQFLMLGLALLHAPRERWVLRMTIASMMGWFLVDATASLWHGAWFNVWMIDLPSLATVGIPWWRLHARL